MIPSRMRLLLPRRGGLHLSRFSCLGTASSNTAVTFPQHAQYQGVPSFSMTPCTASKEGTDIVFPSETRCRQNSIMGPQILTNDNMIRSNTITDRIRMNSNPLSTQLLGSPPPFPIMASISKLGLQQPRLCSTIQSPILQLPARHQVRFFTTSKSDKTDKEGETKSDAPEKSTTTANTKPIQELVDSTVESVRPIVESAEENLKKAADNVRPIVESAEQNLKKAADIVRLGDLASVYGIVLLVFLILTAPFVANRMRGSEGHADRDVDPEDPVMDLAKMLRNEYFGQDGEEGSSVSAIGLDRIVADVLRSPQIQEAVNDLVTKVIQSPQFRNACQVLLKELLRDLLDDPETLKQVIHLLQNAIADEKIREASVQLVTEIFGDERVLDELVVLVQRLGMEQQVQAATQALLVESAHNALNDPEILDHSMEFATDVVGDDVVQQTAGEALYNTLSYAVRPTLSVFLSILGIGLIALSISAFRNANESSSEAADDAFMKSLEDFSSRLLRLISFPLDFLVACKDAVTNLIMFPFRVVSRGLSETKKAGGSFIDYLHGLFLWLFSLPRNLIYSLLEKFGDTYKQIGSQLFSGVERGATAISTSPVGLFVERSFRRISGWFPRTRIKWTIFNHRLADMAISIENFGIRCYGCWQRVIEEVLPKWKENWAATSRKITERWDDTREWRQNMQYRLSSDYNSLNRALARWAVSLEELMVRFRDKLNGLR